MSDLIQQALAGLPKLLPKRTVRYVRGDDYVDIDVTVGSTIVGYEDDHGVRLKAEVRDYLIEPGYLILSDVEIEPTEGDTIIDTTEGATRTYEVMPIGDGIAWRWTDRYHTMFRIHTRQSDEA